MALIKKFFKALLKIFSFKKSPSYKKKKITKKPSRRKGPLAKKIVKGKKVKKGPSKSQKSVKPSLAPPPVKKEEKKVYVGVITHYFSRIEVAVLKMEGAAIAVGDKIVIEGKATNFKQTVKSLQIESVDVKMAKKGKLVGMKIDKAARVGDKVYKLL